MRSSAAVLVTTTVRLQVIELFAAKVNIFKVAEDDARFSALFPALWNRETSETPRIAFSFIKRPAFANTATTDHNECSRRNSLPSCGAIFSLCLNLREAITDFR